MKPSIEWEVRTSFCLYLALMLLLLPLRWLCAVLVAGALHELGHILALKCFNLPLKAIRLGATGASIFTVSGTDKQELFCAAAGPAAGLFTALLFPWFPRLALCSFCQAVFNLIPLMPFDGGRVLRCAMTLGLGQGRGVRIFRLTERVCCILLVLFGLLAVRLSWILTTVSVLIVYRCVKAKENFG